MNHRRPVRLLDRNERIGAEAASCDISASRHADFFTILSWNPAVAGFQLWSILAILCYDSCSPGHAAVALSSDPAVSGRGIPVWPGTLNGIYSILSTHFHVILRNRPDLRNNLTDEQVIRRWRLLYPRKVSKDGAPKPLTKKELKAEVRNKKRVAVLRKRLSDISGMSKSLCEPIAKRANAEATVKGHFFAGRFESIRLLDEEALVACANCVFHRPRCCQTPQYPPYRTETNPR